ncbi:porin [Psychromonas marina]|uniref:Porin n=1 Tax=Psychromonas marina TaxID=88364 RepID=A0ABQ6E177_9GAMM|nr:OmpA family protein [Psychromonas marina]GLS91082.1 porin [Psychromonas marina]
MKIAITGLLALTLFGCSFSAEEQPTAEQSQDQRDDDNDGVINARDKCINTSHTAIVDNDGCPTKVNHEQENDVRVLFANNSSKIPNSFLPDIQRMAKFLAAYPETHIELKGYASPVGNREHNVQLSNNRAERVRLKLISEGVEASRIQTIGFGDDEPIAAGTTEAINVLSRRVVAKVIGSDNSTIEEWTIFTLREN